MPKPCAHCKNRGIDCVGIVSELKAGKSKCQYCTFKSQACTARKAKSKARRKSLVSLPKDGEGDSDEEGGEDKPFRGSVGKRAAGTPIKRAPSGRLAAKQQKTN